METKEIKKLIDKLYDAVHDSGWSSHLHRDTDWHNLYEIRNICNSVLPNDWRLLCETVYGYDSNNTTKSYLFTVENINTGERIIDASVNAHAAGTVADQWSAYDCVAIFWRHE